MGVSKNRVTPKSSILIRFSIINHPFWVYTPIFGEHKKTLFFFVRHPSSLRDSRHDSVMMNPQKVVGLWLAHHGVSQTYARSLGCLSKGGAWPASGCNGNRRMDGLQTMGAIRRVSQEFLVVQ